MRITRTSFLIFLCFFSFNAQAIDRVRLPNNLYIKVFPSKWSAYDTYKLTNKDFEPVMSGYVHTMNWYGNYVYGFGHNEMVPNDEDWGTYYFIYKKGDADARFYDDPFSMNDRLELLGIPVRLLENAMFDSYNFQRRHFKRK